MSISVSQDFAFDCHEYDDFHIDVSLEVTPGINLTMGTYRRPAWFQTLNKFLESGVGDFTFSGVACLEGELGLYEEQETKIVLSKETTDSKYIIVRIDLRRNLVFKMNIPLKSIRTKIARWIAVRRQKAETFIFGRELAKLEKALEDAVSSEFYEDAARIRDQLSTYEDGVTREFRDYKLQKAISSEDYRKAAYIKKEWGVLKQVTTAGPDKNQEWVDEVRYISFDIADEAVIDWLPSIKG